MERRRIGIEEKKEERKAVRLKVKGGGGAGEMVES
jgi:hypothetical protein